MIDKLLDIINLKEFLGDKYKKSLILANTDEYIDNEIKKLEKEYNNIDYAKLSKRMKREIKNQNIINIINNDKLNEFKSNLYVDICALNEEEKQIIGSFVDGCIEIYNFNNINALGDDSKKLLFAINNQNQKMNSSCKRTNDNELNYTSGENSNETIQDVMVKQQVEVDLNNQFPHYISNLPANSSQIIYRCNDIEEICFLVYKKDKILISGMGGYGKSSLAKMLWQRVDKEIDYIGWVDYKGDIKSSILESLNLFDYIEKPEDRLIAILSFFKKYNKSILLIVDNVDSSIIADSFLSKIEERVKLVFTSRMEEVTDFYKYEIRKMTKQECLDVFKAYVDINERDVKEEDIYDVIELLDYNLLLIELVAKYFKYSEKTLNIIIDELRNKNFSTEESSVFSMYDRKYASLFERIKAIYSIQNVSTKELVVLQSFAIIDEAKVPFVFREWFNIDLKILNKLIDFGWIKKESASYSIHPLIRESIRLQQLIDITVCKPFIDYFTNTDIYVDSRELNNCKMGIVYSILEYYCKDDAEAIKENINLIDSYASMCNRLSDYRRLRDVLASFIASLSTNEKEYYYILAILYERLAFNLIDDFYDRNTIVDISKKIFELSKYARTPDDKDACSYKAYYILLIIFQKEKNIKGALHIFNRLKSLNLTSIEWRQVLFTVWSNLIENKMNEECKEFFDNYLANLESELKDFPSELAIFYNNQSTYYYNCNNFLKSTEYDLKAISIREKLGITSDLVQSYYNIALSFYKNADFYNASVYIDKALESAKVIWPHLDNYQCKQILDFKNLF